MKCLLAVLILVGYHLNSQAQCRTIYFVHDANVDNTNQHITYLDHPMINDNPSVLLQIGHNWNPPGQEGVLNNSLIAVWYDVEQARWAIVNENHEAIPDGASFNILIPGNQEFHNQLHIADENNSTGSILNLNLSIDGVDDILFTTHNLTPNGVDNNNPTGVRYEDNSWVVYNENGADMLDGTAFNVLIPSYGTKWQPMTLANEYIFEDEILIYGDDFNNFYLDHRPQAIIITQHNRLNVGYDHEHPMSVKYNESTEEWFMFATDGWLPQAGRVFNTITGYPQAINDDCSNAIDINYLFQQGEEVQMSSVYTNLGGTSFANDPTNGFECWYNDDPLGNTTWFKFTGDGNIYNLLTSDCNGLLEAAGTYFEVGDSQLALYEGSCGNFIPVACNDDSPDAENFNWFAEIEFETVAGANYVLLLDGFNNLWGHPRDGDFCFEVTQLTGWQSVEENLVNTKVYPNPAENVVTISDAQVVQEIVFYNTLGEIVLHQSGLHDSQIEIDITSLASGVYILKVMNGSSSFNHRITKR